MQQPPTYLPTYLVLSRLVKVRREYLDDSTDHKLGDIVSPIRLGSHSDMTEAFKKTIGSTKEFFRVNIPSSGIDRHDQDGNTATTLVCIIHQVIMSI